MKEIVKENECGNPVILDQQQSRLKAMEEDVIYDEHNWVTPWLLQSLVC